MENNSAKEEHTITDTINTTSICDNANYEFNKLPLQQLTDLIQLGGDISHVISGSKTFIKNKADFEKVDIMIRNVEKEFVNLQISIRKSYITTLIEDKKNFIENKKKKKMMKNTSNSHVNKMKLAKPYTLLFMGIHDNNMTSTADILRGFSKFIKEEKDKKNKDIFVYKENNEIDNTSFKIIGKMKVLFEEIKKEANIRGDMITIPEELTFKNIFTYVKYMFEK